jgi:hypothetical protein
MTQTLYAHMNKKKKKRLQAEKSPSVKEKKKFTILPVPDKSRC